MAKEKSQKISHKGKGKYANYRAEGHAEINKMKRILGNNPMALIEWVKNNNTGLLLKRVEKEKPGKFAKAMKIGVFADFAKKFL